MFNAHAFIHTFSGREMFIKFPVEKLKMTNREGRQIYTDGDRRSTCFKIFKRAMILVIDDIIENGIQFQFPKYKGKASSLCIQKITGERYKILRKRGAFKNFDPTTTFNTAYRIEYIVEKDLSIISKTPVHLNKAYTERLEQKALTGQIKSGKLKTYVDYYDEMFKLYPTVCRADMLRILHFGFNQFRLIRDYGCDTLFRDKTFIFYIGRLYTNQDLVWDYVSKKVIPKIHVLYKRLRYIWDGYSYIVLNQTRYKEIEEKVKNNELVDFGRVTLYKIFDEAYFKAYKKRVIIKVKDDFDSKSKFFHMEHLVTDKYEIIEDFNNWTAKDFSITKHNFLTLIPAGKSIQQIYIDNTKPYLRKLRTDRYKRTGK